MMPDESEPPPGRRRRGQRCNGVVLIHRKAENLERRADGRMDGALPCVGSSRLQFKAQALRSITKAEHLHRLIFPAGSAHLGYAHSFCNCGSAAALNAFENQTCKVTEALRFLTQALLRFLSPFVSSSDTRKHLHSVFHRHDVSAASSQPV